MIQVTICGIVLWSHLKLREQCSQDSASVFFLEFHSLRPSGRRSRLRRLPSHPRRRSRWLPRLESVVDAACSGLGSHGKASVGLARAPRLLASAEGLVFFLLSLWLFAPESSDPALCSTLQLSNGWMCFACASLFLAVPPESNPRHVARSVLPGQKLLVCMLLSAAVIMALHRCCRRV